MSKVCVIGSIGVGVCPNHDTPQSYVTTIYTGADTAIAQGENVAIIGSLGHSTCGHTTTALTGSSRVLYKGTTGVHRVGDTGANFGPYTMTTGSNLLIDNT